jgi:hypothetical protein
VCADLKHEQIVYSPWKSTITNVGTVQNFEGIADKFSALSDICLTKINGVRIVNKSVVLQIAAGGVRVLRVLLYVQMCVLMFHVKIMIACFINVTINRH